MNRWQWGSLVVVFACFGAMGIWDAVALKYGGRKASISYLVTMGTFYAPILAMIFGIFAGHLFWPQTSYQDDTTIQRWVTIKVDERGKILSVDDKVVEVRDP